jgi:hypothetical protein
MPATSNSVANEAVVLMGGNQPAVTGTAPNFDQSDAGKALALLYQPTVNAIARKYNWDFARRTVALTPTGNAAPAPYAQEYAYPAGVEVWQLMPPGGGADANNPLPVNFTTGTAIVAAVQARVIWCNLANAIAFYNGSPNEATWDDLFHQAVVRLLSGSLSLAIAGRPDQAFALIESGGSFEAMGETREN